MASVKNDIPGFLAPTSPELCDSSQVLQKNIFAELALNLIDETMHCHWVFMRFIDQELAHLYDRVRLPMHQCGKALKDVLGDAFVLNIRVEQEVSHYHAVPNWNLEKPVHFSLDNPLLHYLVNRTGAWKRVFPNELLNCHFVLSSFSFANSVSQSLSLLSASSKRVARFSPVNTPAITIAVILDSPIGLHQGGQVCAPVFKRIAEQVLEYLRVPHDLDVKSKRTLMASAKNSDVDESSDHLGAPVQDEQTTTTTVLAASGKSPSVSKGTPLADVKASLPMPSAPAPEVAQAQAAPPVSSPEPTPTSGTVVLAVDGGAVVPSFLGKPLRSAVEIAQQSGLEINAIGSGIAREQSPAPGSHLLAGQHITVRFAH